MVIKLILACISLLAVLFGAANFIGGIMWNLADSMPLWWESEDEE